MIFNKSTFEKALQMLFVGLFVTLLANSTKAQNGKAVIPQLGMDLSFNTDDAFWGGLAGVCFPKINASLLATFKGRIGNKRVLVELPNSNNLYQFRERSYLLGLEADKRFVLNEINEKTRFGLFVGGFGGLNFGSYRGTKIGPDASLKGAAFIGPYISDISAAIVKLGYMYLPLNTESVSHHRIFISFSFVIP